MHHSDEAPGHADTSKISSPPIKRSIQALRHLPYTQLTSSDPLPLFDALRPVAVNVD
jgi:hypothetical protein